MLPHAGGLHNIIRGMPFMATDKQGKVQWYSSGQGQLGAEGFVVGAMYVAFAVCCFVLTNAPRLFGHLHGGKGTWYRPICYTLVFATLLLWRRIVDFYRWKTGYHLRFYLLDWFLLKGH
jgi:hypothetical protein